MTSEYLKVWNYRKNYDVGKTFSIFLNGEDDAI